MYPPILKVHLKKDQQRTYLKMFMGWFMCVFSNFCYKSICCRYSFELHRQVDAIQMGTHNICLYTEVDKNYTGCNLKTMELLDCALIGVCAVIRLNTVCFCGETRKISTFWLKKSNLELWICFRAKLQKLSFRIGQITCWRRNPDIPSPLQTVEIQISKVKDPDQ